MIRGFNKFHSEWGTKTTRIFAFFLPQNRYSATSKTTENQFSSKKSNRPKRRVKHSVTSSAKH